MTTFGTPDGAALAALSLAAAVSLTVTTQAEEEEPAAVIELGARGNGTWAASPALGLRRPSSFLLSKN